MRASETTPTSAALRIMEHLLRDGARRPSRWGMARRTPNREKISYLSFSQLVGWVYSAACRLTVGPPTDLCRGHIQTGPYRLSSSETTRPGTSRFKQLCPDGVRRRIRTGVFAQDSRATRCGTRGGQASWPTANPGLGGRRSAP